MSGKKDSTEDPPLTLENSIHLILLVTEVTGYAGSLPLPRDIAKQFHKFLEKQATRLAELSDLERIVVAEVTAYVGQLPLPAKVAKEYLEWLRQQAKDFTATHSSSSPQNDNGNTVVTNFAATHSSSSPRNDNGGVNSLPDLEAPPLQSSSGKTTQNDDTDGPNSLPDLEAPPVPRSPHQETRPSSAENGGNNSSPAGPHRQGSTTVQRDGNNNAAAGPHAKGDHDSSSEDESPVARTVVAAGVGAFAGALSMGIAVQRGIALTGVVEERVKEELKTAMGNGDMVANLEEVKEEKKRLNDNVKRLESDKKDLGSKLQTVKSENADLKTKVTQLEDSTNKSSNQAPGNNVGADTDSKLKQEIDRLKKELGEKRTQHSEDQTEINLRGTQLNGYKDLINKGTLLKWQESVKVAIAEHLRKTPKENVTKEGIKNVITAASKGFTVYEQSGTTPLDLLADNVLGFAKLGDFETMNCNIKFTDNINVKVTDPLQSLSIIIDGLKTE